MLRSAATSNTTMSSSRVNARGWSPWRRGFCDRPPPDGQERVGGLVSEDSQLRTVGGAHSGFRQGPTGRAWIPRGPPQPPYRPQPGPEPYGSPPTPYGPPPPYHAHPPPFYGNSYGINPPYHGMPPPSAFRTPPPVFGPPRPALHRPPQPRLANYYRNWNSAISQPPRQCERFIVLSYNILADYLAKNHASELYFHIPHYMLDWEWRKKRLLFEFGLWAPDIMCLQEVDRFRDLEEELAVQGYTGIWKMRTGNAVDGCAIFWRSDRFQLWHEEHIEFNKFGLRDNVAQICVLESRIQNPAGNESASLPESSDQSSQHNQIIVCNIHVLYNPKRGEIKLGQVRLLLDHAHAVSKIWNDAPVIICGDFNCTPKSPLYNFISKQKISLSGLARDRVSGQYSARIYAPRPSVGPELSRPRPYNDNSNDTANSIKQCTDTHSICKSQSDNENANLFEKSSSPQGQAGLLVVSPAPCSGSHHMDRNNKSHDAVTSEIGGTGISDGQFVGSNSAVCRSADPSGSDRSCTQPSIDTVNICNSGSQEFAPSVLNYQFSPSSSDVSNELIDNIQVDSSTDIKLTSQGLTDSSSKAENNNIEISDVSTSYKDCNGNKIQKEDRDSIWTPSSSTKGSSDMVEEKSVLAKTVFDNDAVKEISSFGAVLGNVPADAEDFTSGSLYNSLGDRTAEKEKAGPVISCQSTCKTNQLDLSSCGDLAVDLTLLDLPPDKAGKTKIQDKSSSGSGDINSSGEIPACISNDAYSCSTYNCNKYELVDSEVSQSSVSSTVGPSNCLTEDNAGVGENDALFDDGCSSVENSDPNFFKELIGTEDLGRFGEEVISPAGSGQKQPPSFGVRHSEFDPSAGETEEDSLKTFPAAATDLGKCSYNPYLLTPMEIEIASGNAECTDVEHNLKLRSVYVDIEDYAGTRDSSGEPQATSYNRQFMGTVDYIWCSEDLQTVKVLDTIPKHVLEQTPGFPTKKWGSDHIALVCQLAFSKDLKTK